MNSFVPTGVPIHPTTGTSLTVKREGARDVLQHSSDCYDSPSQNPVKDTSNRGGQCVSRANSNLSRFHPKLSSRYSEDIADDMKFEQLITNTH